MDILTHALSGMAVATCAATFVPSKPFRKIKVLIAGTLGGTFSDIDAISMWSKFDIVFGKIFNLSHTGKVIYGSKLWYSHHAFFHSLLASLLIGIIFLLSIYLVRRIVNKKGYTFRDFIKPHMIYFIAFVLGYWAHLAGDLPTPASVWGGIALFFPSQDYIGGFGKIWWWNNYDIFLLIVCCISINLIAPLFRYIKERSRVFTLSVLCLTLCLILIQINTRKYNYAYTKNGTYAEMEQNSKKEQERILGERIYKYMTWFDSKMKFYF